MKYIVPFLFIVLFAVSSCKKKYIIPPDLLLGVDYRECAEPYCGGWFIQIGKDTFRFLEIPAKTDVDLNSSLMYPVKVQAVWQHYYNHPWSQVPGLIKVNELWLK